MKFIKKIIIYISVIVALSLHSRAEESAVKMIADALKDINEALSNADKRIVERENLRRNERVEIIRVLNGSKITCDFAIDILLSWSKQYKESDDCYVKISGDLANLRKLKTDIEAQINYQQHALLALP